MLSDARSDDRVCNSPAVQELDVVGYLGIPLITSDGHVLGALCAIDETPRDWEPEQIELLETLARAVLDHIELEAETTTPRSSRAPALQLASVVGATGFEPATFRPPAGRRCL